MRRKSFIENKIRRQVDLNETGSFIFCRFTGHSPDGPLNSVRSNSYDYSLVEHCGTNHRRETKDGAAGADFDFDIEIDVLISKLPIDPDAIDERDMIVIGGVLSGGSITGGRWHRIVRFNAPDIFVKIYLKEDQ
ncbi:MAG TPA: hypothetical protein PK573_07750 [Spirochaetota bacterium]|nr:hypothetical protein [Spirochaetota bacterium]HSA14985.1 hypothetical protein [Spirochaetota bacterium]